MSEALVNAIKATNGTGNAIELTSASNTCTANITNFPHRNLLINGAMQIAQRGSALAAGTGMKCIDRWQLYGSGSAAISQGQSDVAPDGFTKSFHVDVTTAANVGSGEYLVLQQKIEAQNLQHILNGESGAKKLTLSFWVRSSKTGNHAVGLLKPDNTARQNTKTYSVSVADTWEKKTITFDGDTTGGGIANDDGRGLQLDFWLIAGSGYTSVDSTSWVNHQNPAWGYGHAVDLGDNTANNFYLTGVQLEVSDYATDFEYRSIGQELALCQRYYETSYDLGTAPGTATYTGCYQCRDGTASTVIRYYPVWYAVNKRYSATHAFYRPTTGATGVLIDANANGALHSSPGDRGFMAYSNDTGGSLSHYGISFHWTADAEIGS